MIDETLKQERKDLIWLLEEGGRSPSLEDLKNFKDDNEIVKLAVDEDPYALKYASERIRNDKTFVLKICEKEIHAYIYAGDSLWSDKDFALFVAPKVPNCLDHFSSKIQKDPDVLSVYYNENLN